MAQQKLQGFAGLQARWDWTSTWVRRALLCESYAECACEPSGPWGRCAPGVCLPLQRRRHRTSLAAPASVTPVLCADWARAALTFTAARARAARRALQKLAAIRDAPCAFGSHGSLVTFACRPRSGSLMAAQWTGCLLTQRDVADRQRSAESAVQCSSLARRIAQALWTEDRYCGGGGASRPAAALAAAPPAVLPHFSFPPPLPVPRWGVGLHGARLGSTPILVQLHHQPRSSLE